MKKIFMAVTAIILCPILLLSNISLLSIPNSIDYRIDEIRAMWSKGNGPEVDGIDIDYSYYSPVDNGASSEQKYPLIIIMAGALEGLQEGLELVANAMPQWTAAEYQHVLKPTTHIFLSQERRKKTGYIGIHPSLRRA